MRIWNFNDPADLDDLVVGEVRKPKRIRSGTSTASMCSSYKLGAFATVALSMTISASSIVLSHGYVRLPNWSSAVAKNIPDAKMPLEHFFQDRFNPEWTEAEETALIGQIVTNRLMATPSDNSAEVAFVCSNLQESNRNGSPLLTSGVVANIIKKR